MSDSTTNNLGQASGVLHGLRRGFIAVVFDPKFPPFADGDSFDEDIEIVRLHAKQWHSESYYRICPATLGWGRAIEEGGVIPEPPAAEQRPTKKQPSMFEETQC